MAAQQTFTLKLPAARASEILAQLELAGLSASDAPHAFWRAKGAGATITFYKSGKLVLQGAAAADWATEISGAPPPGAPGSVPFAEGVAKLPAPAPGAWIGVDETGKGDYFGPLVVVAARVEMTQLPLLAELGVADSKSLTDRVIKRIAGELKAVVPHHKLVLMPAKYNPLYERIGNLNRLLAWGHGTVAENLLERVDAELILSDQFTKSDLVRRALKERGRAIRFHQRTRAEDDPAVASASILARAELLWRMAELEKTFGVRLPKGAGSPVLSAGRQIVREHGPALLPNVAKLHFRTTQQIGG